MKKVAIVGGGDIGAFIAERLTQEQLDVTVIDRDPNTLGILQNTIDFAGFLGNATSINDLRAADIADADVFIATTRQDETNIISCLLARELKIPHRVAVTRYMGLRTGEEGISPEFLGIDLLVNSSGAVIDEIMSAVEMTGACEVNRFAGGRIILTGMQVDGDSQLAGTRVEDACHVDGVRLFFTAAIVRDQQLIIPTGESVIQQMDYLYLFCAQETMQALNALLKVETIKTRSAVINGDNFLSEHLAAALLNRHFNVTMLAASAQQAAVLTQAFEGRKHFHVEIGDGMELRLLRRVKVPQTSVFISTKSDDTNNLTACILAKSLGVGKTIASIQRDDIMQLALKLGVDVTVAPRLATAKVIQKMVHEGKVVDYRPVSQTNLEVIELVAQKGSRAVRQPLLQIKLPQGVVIGAVVQKNGPALPAADLQLEPNDRAVLLTIPEHFLEVERIFGN